MYEVNEIRPHVFAIDEDSVRMYLIVGEDKALLIDSGFGTGDLPALIKELCSVPVMLVHTHAHFDHTGWDKAFDEVYAHPNEYAELLETGVAREEQLRPLYEGDEIRLGGRTLTVWETPGHTAGSLSFLDSENRLLFTGDNVSDATVFLCMKGADIHKYRESIVRTINAKEQYDVLLGCHGKAEQSAAQAGKMLAIVDAILAGKVKGEKWNAYDDNFFMKVELDGASVYLPLDWKF